MRNFRKYILPGFVMLNTALHAQVSSDDSIKLSRQLIRIEQTLMDVIPMGDTMTWKKYLADDFFIVTEDGTRFERSAFLSGFSALPKGYASYIKVIKPKVIFHKEAAVISYVADEYETVFEQKLHTTYGVMNTYMRSDTSWKMIASQVYEIPQLPQTVKIPVKEMKRFTGTYQMSDSNFVYITLERDTLFYQRNTRPKRALFPETATVFFTMADTRGRKMFVTDTNGVMMLHERRNGQDVVWRKIK